jgi:hypothetical protein
MQCKTCKLPFFKPHELNDRECVECKRKRHQTTKCKGCGFPFPPHELREDHCFECVWKQLANLRVADEATQAGLRACESELNEAKKQLGNDL